MTRKEFLQHYWRYYLVLEEKFKNTLNYIELDWQNAGTFSNEYALLLQSIGAELDNFFKVYCGFAAEDRKNMNDYCTFVLSDYSDIVNQKILIPERDMEFLPYQGWSAANPAQSLTFWNGFCKIKHSRYYKEAILSTANILNLSKASVTSYLPYKKGVYFPSTEKEKISVGAERQRRYRVMKRWRVDPTEENFWGVVLAYAGIKFKTYSGLPFSYEIKKGKNGEYTKELWIDRREKSKSLAWSSIVLALGNIKEEVVDRPKALGDIRGVTYIYGMFYQFGLIDVPDKVKEKMGRPINRKK